MADSVETSPRLLALLAIAKEEYLGKVTYIVDSQIDESYEKRDGEMVGISILNLEDSDDTDKDATYEPGEDDADDEDDGINEEEDGMNKEIDEPKPKPVNVAKKDIVAGMTILNLEYSDDTDKDATYVPGEDDADEDDEENGMNEEDDEMNEEIDEPQPKPVTVAKKDIVAGMTILNLEYSDDTDKDATYVPGEDDADEDDEEDGMNEEEDGVNKEIDEPKPKPVTVAKKDIVAGMTILNLEYSDDTDKDATYVPGEDDADEDDEEDGMNEEEDGMNEEIDEPQPKPVTVAKKDIVAGMTILNLEYSDDTDKDATYVPGEDDADEDDEEDGMNEEDDGINKEIDEPQPNLVTVAKKDRESRPSTRTKYAKHTRNRTRSANSKRRTYQCPLELNGRACGGNIVNLRRHFEQVHKDVPALEYTEILQKMKEDDKKKAKYPKRRSFSCTVDGCSWKGTKLVQYHLPKKHGMSMAQAQAQMRTAKRVVEVGTYIVIHLSFIVYRCGL